MKKQIVFYCASHPFEMVYKMARLFKKKGYETVLVTMSEKDRFDYSFYSQAFSKIICSDFQFFKPSLKTPLYLIKRGPSFIKFLISIKLLNPYAVIGISGASWQLKLVHKYFFKKYPFIYFPYDILSFSFDSKTSALKYVKEFEIEAEKYCFENSQGVIHKGDPKELSSVSGRIHKNLKLPANQLSFLPYCSEEFEVPINKNKLSRKDKSLHMVYVGGFPSDPKFSQQLLEIFNTILHQNIHIHTYMTFKHVSEKQENQYIQTLFSNICKNKLFYLHNPLDAKAIIPEISKYDFGFWSSNLKSNGNIEPRFATGNKLSSYLESGIPFIYNKELIFVNNLMKTYNLSMSFDGKTIKKLNLKKINTKQNEKSIIKARKELSMERNFPRLESFITKISEDFNKNVA